MSKCGLTVEVQWVSGKLGGNWLAVITSCDGVWYVTRGYGSRPALMSAVKQYLADVYPHRDYLVC